VRRGKWFVKRFNGRNRSRFGQAREVVVFRLVTSGFASSLYDSLNRLEGKIVGASRADSFSEDGAHFQRCVALGHILMNAVVGKPGKSFFGYRKGYFSFVGR
jgi:hypothetical protein